MFSPITPFLRETTFTHYFTQYFLHWAILFTEKKRQYTLNNPLRECVCVVVCMYERPVNKWWQTSFQVYDCVYLCVCVMCLHHNALLLPLHLIYFPGEGRAAGSGRRARTTSKNTESSPHLTGPLGGRAGRGAMRRKMVGKS